MENSIKVTIDNLELEVPSGSTILEAARYAGIKIPTLCYMKEINEIGACRVCLVEVEGARGLQAACVQPATDGMNIKTSSKQVRDARRSTVELILSNHNRDCLTCVRNKKCELQTVAEELQITKVDFEGDIHPGKFDDSCESIVRDQSKCILCGRCVSVCKKRQEIGILDFTNRGFETEVSPAFNRSMNETPCIKCGQCIMACPVAALTEKDEIDQVLEALEDPTKHVVVQTAPAIRTALGEEFGYPVGTGVTGQMVTALKRLGFDKVYDTVFGADLTIMEEGHELLHRIQNDGVLPMITSCSPGWVNYCEYFHPDLLPNLSSCKSPHQMVGAIVKSYYAKNKGIDPKDIYMVSIMPCVAKKGEAARPELSVNGHQDVDAVLTTRELARMIKTAGIQFTQLKDSAFDADLLGENTGAGVIFGATGGVMEAALRTVADVLEGADLEQLEYNAVRGVEGIKEASVTLGGKTINVALAHGSGAAKRLMEMVKSGEKDYHFIEVMGCSGGCVTGGGQPHVHPALKNEIDIRVERAKVLYGEDRSNSIRKSHQNPLIQKLYADYLGEPNGHLAHELLHTHYEAKEHFPETAE